MNNKNMQDDDKLILLNQTKFHVESSKKFLLTDLKPYNIDKEALKIIKESFNTLLYNLNSLIKSDSTFTPKK